MRWKNGDHGVFAWTIWKCMQWSVEVVGIRRGGRLFIDNSGTRSNIMLFKIIKTVF